MSQQPIIFDGVNGLSSDTLIRLVRLRSLEAGREKDDSWIAITASACFEGNALEWYEDQTEETQDSWKLLRRALLQRWPPCILSPTIPTKGSSDNLSISPISIPTPAAAPPPPMPGLIRQRSLQARPVPDSLRIGRIRVDYQTGGVLDYLSETPIDACEYVTTQDQAKALVVEFGPCRGPHDMILASSSTQGIGVACKAATLAMVDTKLTQGDLACVSLCALRRPSPLSPWVSQSSKNAGGVNSAIWTVSIDGRIALLWEISGKRALYPLDTAVVDQSADSADCGKILLVSDFMQMVGSTFAKNAKWHLIRVDLKFEPL